MFEPEADELQNRIKGFQTSLNNSSMTGALLFDIVDLYYYSGSVGPGCMFIPAQGDPVFLSRQRGELPAALPWKTAKYRGWSDLARILEEFGYRIDRQIGLELDVLPVVIFQRLQSLWPGVAFVDVSNQIRLQRAVKSAWELKVMRESARIDQRIWEQVPEFITKAGTDLELTALLDGEVRRQGHVGVVRCHGFSMEMVWNCVLTGEDGTAVGSYDGPTTGLGVSKSFPIGASGTRLEPGKPIIVDHVSSFFGYTLDTTRTYSIGKPAQKVLEAYNLVLSVQAELMEYGIPGMSCGELYDRARALAEKAGWSHGFMGAAGGVPFVGHGIGLEVDELPVLAKGSRQLLVEGMTLAIEPKIVLPGLGPVGVENTCVVTSRGLEKLSALSDELVIC